ncbi:MAG TPA: restriction endonuclease [Methylocystis sp.]|nr:restriction endonuclease [Methylocystis sp.]
MKPGNKASSETRRERRLCLAWFVVFTLLAGWHWPSGLGVACMALAYLGVLHLAMLTFEEVTGPKFHAEMSPEEFERYCASLLRERKWDARVTPASGDQGVDIVADKRGLRIVVQCKKYSKPVGNRAVQEIVAGIAHRDAQRGVVVATNGYTASAKKLAASNEVLLLHHTELHRIDRLLSL